MTGFNGGASAAQNGDDALFTAEELHIAVVLAAETARRETAKAILDRMRDRLWTLDTSGVWERAYREYGVDE